MALVRPFQALRPSREAAFAVAAVPYDVVTTDEARVLAEGNPLSFLHASRAEIGLPPETDPHGEAVYRKAEDNFSRLRREAPFILEETPSLYCYRLRHNNHEQTGVAGCYSLEEYDQGLIKKHERTRRDKEDDRTRHMLALQAQTGVVFLTYRASDSVKTVVQHTCQRTPVLDFTAVDGVQHTLWRLSEIDQAAVAVAFGMLPALYIADGHHRIASAARVRDKLLARGDGDAHIEAQFVLGVAFPDTETRILAYNRTVTTLGGYTSQGFLKAISARFAVRPDANPDPYKGQVAMYLSGTWYAIDLSHAAKEGGKASQVDKLDTAVLQDRLLAPLLQVVDVRTDPRIGFVGGARGVSLLEGMVDSGQAAVAFSLAPVTPEELLAVSDAGGMMPPKSTWFEPKLRDGLLIHLI